jgi:hypothetical protein
LVNDPPLQALTPADAGIGRPASGLKKYSGAHSENPTPFEKDTRLASIQARKSACADQYGLRQLHNSIQPNGLPIDRNP